MNMRSLRSTFLFACSALYAAAQQMPAAIPLWGRFEAVLTSDKSYEYALHDVNIAVRFTSPSGAEKTVDAFWDGERTWRVRFSPDQPGRWTYRTVSSDALNRGLHEQTGAFECRRYPGTNRLYQHGALRLSADRHYIQHADGTPFFWLSDTCWAGAMLSGEKEWRTYLEDRAGKGFTAVQFMGTQNIAAAGDAQGRQAFGGREKIVIDPYFFRRLDTRFDSINEAGLIASPTFAWAAEWHPSGKLLDVGAWLPDEELIRFGRYFVARYGAHQVVWMFAGDHDYRGPKAERWRKLGRAIFGEAPDRLVTVHPAPRMLLKHEFGSEPWLGFLGYQSSHSSADATIQWIVEGEPAKQWSIAPVTPVINIEPIYEAHFNFGRDRLASALDVRQAVWWSLLVSPTAGVSYGAHGVWSWETQQAIPMNHYRTGVARPWHEAIHLPGSTHMRHMQAFFSNLPWWKLRPAQNLLAGQSEPRDVQRLVAAARADDGTAVFYVPSGERVKLSSTIPGSARWFDPTQGTFIDAKDDTGYTPPARNAAGDSDWVLLIQPEATKSVVPKRDRRIDR